MPAFVLVLTQCLTAHSQNNDIFGTPDTLGSVVVTGQFRPQPAERSIYPVEVLDQKQIRLKAANNLGELLRTEPGFQLRSDGILGDFIRIRGLTGEHVKILIDGMPVTGRVADRIDLTQLTLENVERIEIIKGPMSVIYGSNALAGAINIITRDYEKEKSSLHVTSWYESAGTWNFNIRGIVKKKQSRLSLHAARNFFEGWGPVDTSRYKTWKPKLQYTGGAGYHFKNNRLEFSLLSDLMSEELRDKGALTLANLYEKALDTYHYTTRWNNRLNLVYKNNDDFLFNFQSGYSYYRKRKITWLNDLVNLNKTIAENNALHDTTIFHMSSFRGYISNIPGKALEYQAGFDINYEEASGKRTGGNRNSADYSLFMNLIINPAKNFRIQPGMRLMKHSDFKAPLIYGLSVDYKTGGFSLKTSYARGYRAPSLKQLYLQFIDNNHEIHGNENLEPETAENLVINAEYTLLQNRHMLTFETGFFFNNLHNAVQLAISTQQPGWGKYFNVEQRFTTMGFEASLNYMFSPGFSFTAGFVNTGRTKLDNSGKYFWSGDITSSTSWIHKASGLKFGLQYKYTDEYLEFAGNYNTEGVLQNIAQQETDGYHIMDFTVLRSFWKNRIDLSTGIKNIFNVKQVNSTGSIDIHGSVENNLSVAYGRAFFVGITFNFSQREWL